MILSPLGFALLAAMSHVPDDEPRVATYAIERPPGSAVGGAAAMMHARLAIVGNCVLVRGENGEAVVPVFGAGTAFWDKRAGRLDYLGRRYRPGEIVAIGGGGVNPAAVATLLSSGRVDLPSDCPAARLWFTGG